MKYDKLLYIDLISWFIDVVLQLELAHESRINTGFTCFYCILSMGEELLSNVEILMCMMN